MNSKGKFESYESFISRVDEEAKYIASIDSERPEDQAAIKMTVADGALTRILKGAHTAAHPYVVQIRNLVSSLEGKSYAECCDAFRKEERQWSRERVPDPDQLHVLGYSKTDGGGATNRKGSKVKPGKGDGATPHGSDGKYKGKCYNCNKVCGYLSLIHI